MEQQILTKEKITEILDLADTVRYDGIINIDVEQALLIMLKITFHFKYEMDYQIQWFAKHKERVDKELKQFMAEQGIKNLQDDLEWVHQNGALEYHICIPDLLLHTLYSLNGTHFRDRDRDYEWEEELYKIFYHMPSGREFEEAMLDFLLLPLYNRTHGTNYIIQGD